MDDQLLHPSRILVVDDQEANALLLQAILARAGYRAVEILTDPLAVVRRCSENPPDLLLLDWHMPARSGPQILEEIGFLTDEPTWMPVLVVTADMAPDTKRRALSLGARDFLTKPIDVPEVLLRVRNLLQTRFLRIELQLHNELLHERVQQRTSELEDAKLEMLDRLALAAEYRDDATGQHAERIGRTSELLALELGLAPAEAILIGHAARLHDIGKIGIADELLLKPGAYSADEFDAMKLHSTIGARILSGSTNELLRMAEQIALTHHERWDGQGYPNSHAAEDIPLPGRIVTVADVHDALTHRRPYKEPWPIAEATHEILEASGSKFDPRVVEAFARLDHVALVRPAARPGLLAAVEAGPAKRGPGTGADAQAA
ncbi:MAG: cyclic di-GMP phosphodiesterase [Gaiellales bacterium]|nr:cyclic di-GMP phosphodiesterase [Gaiellales bacterium]